MIGTTSEVVIGDLHREGHPSNHTFQEDIVGIDTDHNPEMDIDRNPMIGTGHNPEMDLDHSLEIGIEIMTTVTDMTIVLKILMTEGITRIMAQEHIEVADKVTTTDTAARPQPEIDQGEDMTKVQ